MSIKLGAKELRTTSPDPVDRQAKKHPITIILDNVLIRITWALFFGLQML